MDREHHNFLDSDIKISGPLVSGIRESFDLYWNSPLAQIAPMPQSEAVAREIAAFIQTNARDSEVLAHIQAQGDSPVLSAMSCNDLSFVTDYPGVGVAHRRVYPALVNELAHAKTSVVVESPYFVLRPDGQAVLRELVQRGVSVSVLTNSLNSTDAYYTVAAALPTLLGLVMPGFELWAYQGEALQESRTAGASPDLRRWGVHAKRAVIDDATVVIGTYNLDPRSANLNSELIVICRKSPELAQAMRASIERRRAQARLVVDGERLHGLGPIVGEAGLSEITKMILAVPLSSFFDVLL